MYRHATSRRLLHYMVAAVVGISLYGCSSPQPTRSPSAVKSSPSPGSHAAAPSRGETTSVVKEIKSPSPRSSRADGMQQVTLAYPTGDPKTSAIGIVKTAPREVVHNNPFTYELEATNFTNQPLENVTLTEKPSSTLQIRSSAPRGQISQDGTVSWSLGRLEPRQSKTVRVTALASGEGAVSSCAAISYNSSLCTSIDVVQPKLLIAISGPTDVLRCDDIVYQYRVTNTGTGTVQDVRISDALPDGLMTTDGKNAVEFNVGALAPDQSRQHTARLKASKKGRFVYKATAIGKGGLTAVSNQVATQVREPQLQLIYNAPNQQFIGRNGTNEITVRNTGDGPANQTTIEHSVPTGLQLVSLSSGARQADGKILWNLGTLSPGQSQTVSLTLKGSREGTMHHTAVASATCASAVSAKAQTQYRGIPAILLEVVDLEDPTEVGSNQTYVITATNQGSAAGTNIRIVCTLEDNMQYLSTDGATVGRHSGDRVVFEPLISLSPAAKAEWRVTVKAVRPGDVRFKVSMTSDQLNRPVEETEATNMYK